MGSLDVNGNITEGESSGTSSVLDLAAEDYYLGGVDDYSIVSPRAGTEVGFTGCIESLRVRHYLCSKKKRLVTHGYRPPKETCM